MLRPSPCCVGDHRGHRASPPGGKRTGRSTVAYLEEDPWDEPDEGDDAEERSTWQRPLLQWLLTVVGIASLGLGLVLVIPSLPLPGPRPIIAIVLLISVGAWLLRLAWRR